MPRWGDGRKGNETADWVVSEHRRPGKKECRKVNRRGCRTSLKNPNDHPKGGGEELRCTKGSKVAECRWGGREGLGKKALEVCSETNDGGGGKRGVERNASEGGKRMFGTGVGSFWVQPAQNNRGKKKKKKAVASHSRYFEH